MNFVRMQDGVRIAYDDSGSGPVIVFAHCLGGSRAIWAPLIARWQDRYRCIAYDLRGQGDSETTPGPYAMPQLAADGLELLDALAIERCVFAGVSMGGMVAQHLALLAPQRVSALILADTAAGFDAAGRAGWDERIAQLQRDGIAPLVDTMMGRWFTESFRRTQPQAVAAVAAILARTDLDGYLASCAAVRDHDLLARLQEIKPPTLVVCGENDPSTPLALSQALAAGIPGAWLEVLPGLNHLPNFEAPE
ncbi:MAG TPA: alpha/beta fold hydrolase, partial [Rhodocyclaceae bacterium]|nr:alpha/beta fold hydrolase [Rhodocyclaceae bacterium]